MQTCNQPNYMRAVVIVHGKSELQMVKHVKSKLRLNMGIHASENGNSSIEICGLSKELQRGMFRNKTAFSKQYLVEQDRRTLKNFKLFMIMDTDDTREIDQRRYMDKSMFANHWLQDYICPIYNVPSLEDVLFEAKLIDHKFDGKEKMKNYPKIFPISSAPMSQTSVEEIGLLRDRLSSIPKTNMSIFLDYCIEWAKDIYK